MAHVSRLGQFFLLHISSSYAKILGETNFQPWEIPRSGWKAKDVEEEEKSQWKQRPASHPRKLPGPKFSFPMNIQLSSSVSCSSSLIFILFLTSWPRAMAWFWFISFHAKTIHNIRISYRPVWWDLFLRLVYIFKLRQGASMCKFRFIVFLSWWSG